MDVTMRALLGQLEAEGFSPDEDAAQAIPGADAAPAPWFVRVLVGAGAWMAAALLLSFLSLTGMLGQGWPYVLAGAALVAGALAARHRGPRGVFAAQLGLALSLAGQALLIGGVGMLTQNELAVGAAALALFAGLALAYPDAAHRFIMALLAGQALGWVLALLELPGAWHVSAVLSAALSAALLELDVRAAASWLGAVVRPAALGLLLGAPLQLDVWGETFGDGRAPGWLAGAGLGLVALAVAARALWERRPAPAVLAAAGGALAAGIAVGLWEPGALAAALMVALGFRHGSRPLLGLGALALVLYLGRFYYSLDITLLQKSGLLALTGAALLGLRLLARVGARPAPAGRAAARAPAAGRAAAAGLLVALGATAALVGMQERTLAGGRVVLLELAPVDPRSLMQGDYMRLAYAVADDIAEARDRQARLFPEGVPLADNGARRELPREGAAVLRITQGGVGRFERLDSPRTPLAPDEVRLRYRVRDGRVVIGGETFFFREGDGELYAEARYAELRVAELGDAVLAGLRGAALEPLGPAAP